MKNKLILVFGATLLLALPALASRSVVKCAGGIIHIDDLKYQVNEKCGEPLHIEQISGDDETRIERATIKARGSLYELIYRGGKLARIERA